MLETSVKRKSMSPEEIAEEEAANARKEAAKAEARGRRAMFKKEGNLLNKYFDAVRAAVKNKNGIFQFARDKSMSTFAALASYANDEVQPLNDRFDIIWKESNIDTKLWIWNNIQNLIINQTRTDKLLVEVHHLQQAVSLGQDASNPYFITRGYLIK